MKLTDITRCPIRSFDESHYHADGVCKCELKKAHCPRCDHAAILLAADMTHATRDIFYCLACQAKFARSQQRAHRLNQAQNNS